MKQKGLKSIAYVLLGFALGLMFFFSTYSNQHLILTNINEDGSFVLSKDKISWNFSKDEAIRKFNWYLDPYCPDCIRVHSISHDAVEKARQSGELEIKYHPLNFTSHKSHDYSLIASAILIGVADNEKNPQVVDNFMHKLFNEEFKKDFKHLTNPQISDAIFKLAKASNVSDATIRKVSKHLKDYEFIINKASVNIRRYDKWKEISDKEDKTFYVPFIYQEGKKALNGETENPLEDIVGAFNGEVHCQDACQ